MEDQFHRTLLQRFSSIRSVLDPLVALKFLHGVLCDVACINLGPLWMSKYLP